MAETTYPELLEDLGTQVTLLMLKQGLSNIEKSVRTGFRVTEIMREAHRHTPLYSKDGQPRLSIDECRAVVDQVLKLKSTANGTETSDG